MHHPARRKMHWHLVLLLILYNEAAGLTINVNNSRPTDTDDLDNNIIDFDTDYDIKLDQKYGLRDVDFSKANRYTIVKQEENKTQGTTENVFDTTTDLNVIPLELISTTENELIALIESTTEPDLTVIPLSTTTSVSNVKIEVSVPTSTEVEFTSTETIFGDTTEVFDNDEIETTTNDYKIYVDSNRSSNHTLNVENTKKSDQNKTLYNPNIELNYDEDNITNLEHVKRNLDDKTNITETLNKTTDTSVNKTIDTTVNKTNITIATNKTINKNATDEENVHIFTELDEEEELEEVPEDYYDSKDVLPTKPPNTDALSVIFGLAGSVVESVAERVVPKGIFDLFKRMQKQNEALEAERLRSREENGGIGQFGRGILKSISSSISKPFSALMVGVKDIGSLDTDRGFVSSAAAGVTSVANSVSEAFKNRVQAIYPGTIWCGDGHSAQARSSDLGLFFFTDTCCRQHDACKIYIKAGETKYGLTNTGLFTRSHCSCDLQFRECLRKTNSLVSSQIGLTYFNVLGPQCFRKAHPIVRCLRKTRITGQKCEEYELDYSKSKMWQWFDNETF